jgi:hypothetical protein
MGDNNNVRTNDYEARVLEKKILGNTENTVISYSRNDNTQLDIDEVVKLIETLKAGFDADNTLFSVRGLVGGNWSTIKSINEDLDIVDWAEYYAGRMLDATKFEKFSQIHINIYKKIKKDKK